jgi:hypothetical protein
MVLNEQSLREMVLEELEAINENQAMADGLINQFIKFTKAGNTKGVDKIRTAMNKLARKSTHLNWDKLKNFKKAAEIGVKKAAEIGGQRIGHAALGTGFKEMGKQGGVQALKWLGVRALALGIFGGVAAAYTAYQIGSWIWDAYRPESPEEALARLKADNGKKVKDKYQVIVQGPNGEEEKWFKSQKKRREWMACYKKRGGGDINFDVNAPPCGTAAAVPTAKPKVAVKKRRGKSSRCAGKGWGRYKMPADVPYKSFKEFYAALAGNVEALAALGKPDCRWGSKHTAAYKMLSGAGATAKKPCLPGQKRIEDLQGNSFCWPPKDRIKQAKTEIAPEDESLASIKNDPKALGWSGPRARQWESKESVKTLLADEKYERLLEQLLKENV